MSIDPGHERLITFNQAAALLARPPHPSTWSRWFNRGVRGIVLETVVVGGRRYTSGEAVRRFVAAVTASRNGQSLDPNVEQPA